MGYYLLTIEGTFGEWQEYLTLTIEAQDRQMVKYHFHNTFKNWGFKDTQFGKHCLEHWDFGVMKEISEIREVDQFEFNILDTYMTSFYKAE